MERVDSVSPMRNAMSDEVYALLKGDIIDMSLEPGTKLRIEMLSSRFDVSPTPVREALNRLAAEGLITVEAYRGFRVSQLLEPDELVDLLRAREVIELAAVDSAVQKGAQDYIGQLHELTVLMDELAQEDELNIREFNAADSQFHRVLVEMSGNMFLVQAFDALHSHVQISRHYKGRSSDQARLSNAEHKQIVDAVKAQDLPQSSKGISVHVNNVVQRLGVVPIETTR